MNKFWGVPVVSLYFYMVTILTQYGFNSYFNIPSNFIEVSIRDNIIYFFQLFQIARAIVGFMQWWMWIITFLAILIIIFFHKLNFLSRKINDVLVVVILLLSLYGSYNFGNKLAENTTYFYTIPSDCLQTAANISYIIPAFYNEKIILIPIENDTRKIKGGFIVKDASSLNCAIEFKDIGKITK